jgi:hypothetical protein
VDVVRGEVVLLDPAVAVSSSDIWLLLDGCNKLLRGNCELRFVESVPLLACEIILLGWSHTEPGTWAEKRSRRKGTGQVRVSR